MTSQHGSHPTNEWAFVWSAPAGHQPLLRYIIVLVGKLGIAHGAQVEYVERFARTMNHPAHFIGSGVGDVRVRAINVSKPLPQCDAAELGYIARALEKVVKSYGGQDHE